MHGVKCDYVCRHITVIDPIETPILSWTPKAETKYTYHQWVQDKLTPVEQHTGWWWRYVVKWFNDLRWKMTARKAQRP